MTALEIKTGKHQSVSHRGQVIIYSLLISERFIASNTENILLYIMNEDKQLAFQYIKQKKVELDQLIMKRNELAKWQKINSTVLDPWKDESLLKPVIFFPPMIKWEKECSSCFTKEVCSICSIAIEDAYGIQKPEGAGQFQAYKEMEMQIT